MSNISWELLPWQIEAWKDPARFRVIAAGRRCGKSNLSIKITLAEALAAPKGSAVVYVAPTQGQCRQIAWDALLEQGREVIKSAHVNSMDITLITGVKIHLRSAETPDNLRGLKLHFACIDEAAFIKDSSLWFKVLRPALADLKGRAMFISSPSGRNWFYDLFKLGESGEDSEWKSWHLTTFDNPTIDKNEIESARKTLSSFEFKSEFMASFDSAGTDIFKEEWFKTGKKPTYGSYIIAGDVAGFDEPSNGKSNKKRLDETAFVVVFVDDKGEWFVEKIVAGKWSVKDTAMKLLNLISEYKPVSVGMERGITKQAVDSYLPDLMRRTNVYAHIENLTHSNQKKVDRITWALQGRLEHGRITFNEDEDWEEVREQLTMFPTNGVKDDQIDALAYCAQLTLSSYQQEYEEDEHMTLDIISGY